MMRASLTQIRTWSSSSLMVQIQAKRKSQNFYVPTYIFVLSNLRTRPFYIEAGGRHVPQTGTLLATRAALGLRQATRQVAQRALPPVLPRALCAEYFSLKHGDAHCLSGLLGSRLQSRNLYYGAVTYMAYDVLFPSRFD
eukprot:3089975-Pleurochrysis_carterae.AAC.2